MGKSIRTARTGKADVIELVSIGAVNVSPMLGGSDRAVGSGTWGERVTDRVGTVMGLQRVFAMMLCTVLD